MIEDDSKGFPCTAGSWSCHLLMEEQAEREGRKQEAGSILDGLNLRCLVNGDHEYAVVYSSLEFRGAIWAVQAFAHFSTALFILFLLFVIVIHIL